MTPDEAIAIVKSKANGRTRYEGQKPFLDEVLVAEIERLRAQANHPSVSVECKTSGGGIDAIRDGMVHAMNDLPEWFDEFAMRYPDGTRFILTLKEGEIPWTKR
jgi:hypothetical protein